MPLHGSERRLHRLVARLASAPTEDVRSVLAALDEHERAVVAAILEALPGEPVGDAAQDLGRGGLEEASAWLSHRLSLSRGGHDTGDVHMTLFALKMLDDAAAEVWSEARAPASPASVAAPPIMGRLKEAVSRWSVR